MAVAGYLLYQWIGLRRAHRLGVLDRLGPAFAAKAVPALMLGAAGAYVGGQLGIPLLVLLLGLLVLVAELLMRRTCYGAKLYAVGGNPDAARLAGIDIPKVIWVNFVIAGLVYGITGVALTARVSGAVVGSAGLFLELDAIAAAIIGGTSLAGGRGRILGALLMGSLNNGMSLMNVPTFYQETARRRAARRGGGRPAQPPTLVAHTDPAPNNLPREVRDPAERSAVSSLIAPAGTQRISRNI